MNGQASGPPSTNISIASNGRGKVALKYRNGIKRTSAQIVFMDEGKVTPDSFAVHYDMEEWWDIPEVRHGDGQIFSFADNHAEYWKWSSETIDIVKAGQLYRAPQTNPGKQDLYRIQLRCWGKLGYTPSVRATVD